MKNKLGTQENILRSVTLKKLWITDLLLHNLFSTPPSPKNGPFSYLIDNILSVPAWHPICFTIVSYDFFRHHRHSLRLQGYNYSWEGAYFVTICTQFREMLLDSVPVRRMVQDTWDDLTERFSNIELDEFVIMPNHVHGIIWIVGATPRGCPTDGIPQSGAATGGRPYGDTLYDIVHWFKSMTTTRYRMGVDQAGWPPFMGRLWQRNYYERIIRNDRELNATRQYIQDNPQNWDKDPENI